MAKVMMRDMMSCFSPLQLPRYEQWARYCHAIIPFFFGGEGGQQHPRSGEIERAFGQLRAYCEIDMRSVWEGGILRAREERRN